MSEEMPQDIIIHGDIDDEVRMELKKMTGTAKEIDSDEERDGDDGGYRYKSRKEESLTMQGSSDKPAESTDRNDYRYVRKSMRTGPKGVLQDYKDEKARLLEERQFDQEQLEARLRNMVILRHVSQATQEQYENEEEEDDEDDDLDEEDAEFFRQYREKRLQEISASHTRIFGSVTEVDRSNFVQEIDEESEEVYVVVHLYQENIKACRLVNHALVMLAREFPSTKFLKIWSTEAQADFDEIALPTIIVYKDKQVVETFLRVQDDLGEEFDELALMTLLTSKSRTENMFQRLL